MLIQFPFKFDLNIYLKKKHIKNWLLTFDRILYDTPEFLILKYSL